MLELIDSPAPREVRLAFPVVGDSGPGVVLIAPQDAESNSELARVASANAAKALGSSLAGLSTSVCDFSTLRQPLSATVELTVAQSLAYHYREAIELVTEAGERMAQTGAAVSDAAYSRQTDSAAASIDALAPFASRTAAAHMLVGGELGLPAIAGVADEGFFSRANLSGEGQRALQWFRAAAIDPGLIRSEGPGATTIDDIAMGTGSVTLKDSLRLRLGLMQDRDLLLNAPTADVVYELLGVSRDGFSEAREHLRQELRAFDRSRDAVVPPELLPDGGTTADFGVTLYAATRVPPSQLLPSYWSAVLRFDPTPRPTLSGVGRPVWPLVPDDDGNLSPGDTWGEESNAPTGPSARTHVAGRRTVASVIDEAHRSGADALQRLCPSGTCGPGLESAANVIAGVVADLAPNPNLGAGSAPRVSYETSPYIGRARACWYQTGTTLLFPLELHAPVPADELLVVEGRDGLECAVRGALEGVPCTLDQWAAAQPTHTAWAAPPGDATVLRTFVNGVTPGTRPRPDTVALFVVRRRSGVDPVGQSLPGQFEELTGFILAQQPGGGSGYRFCMGAPIVPRLDREAATLMEPSPTPPHRPAESCAGLPSDMRIPLENELTAITSAAPDRESSWFHYLELARRSSQEADALGEDVIRTGLEMDARAEAATDELSRLCGVSINLTSIASTLESDSVPRLAAAGPPCALPYVQQDDACVLDAVLYAASRSLSDADMGRLSACLGTDVVPWATLGDTALCAWDATPGVPGGICDGATREVPCPFLADSAGECGMPPPIPGGSMLIEVPERLGLFNQPPEPQPPPPNPNDLPCSALSDLRSGVPLSAIEESLEELLQWDTLALHARQLTWEALVGDYSVVRYAGSIVFRTGSVTNTMPTQWPMGAPPPGACPAGGFVTPDPSIHSGPLFCLQGVDATDRLHRAQTNDLLLRAVFAARIFTGAGLQGNVVPYYSTNRADDYRIIEDTFAWDPIAGTMPRAACTWAGQIYIDHDTGDLADPYTREVGDLGTRACKIENTAPGSPGVSCGTSIPPGAEWAVCPYDRTECEVFDDQDDCDDGVSGGMPGVNDRNLPLILRAVDDDLNVASARSVATEIWRERLPEQIRLASGLSRSELLTTPAWGAAGVPLSELTRYFLLGEDGGRVPLECRREYETCVDGLPGARLMLSGNVARVPATLNFNDLLNGIELTCYAARQGLPPEDINCEEPNPINDLADSFRMAGYLECRANGISGRGANSLIANLPRRVIDVLRTDGEAATYGTGAGELDAQVSEIRSALVALGSHRINIAADARAYASRIRALQVVVAQSERSREIEDLMFVSRTADRITQCATAIFDAAAATASATEGAGGGFRAASAATTCVNSAVQIGLDRRISDLRLAGIDDSVIEQFASFDGESAEFGRRMSERALAIRAELERLDAALSRLRANQMQARRALARALLLDDDGMGAHMAVNTVYRSRYNTQLQRYRRAHQRAVRAAFIARLALEQRLGMPLADISDDVFSDEPPREWVDEICTLPSIDYDAIRMASPGTTGTREGDTVEFPGPDDYSGAYVGDYVRRLEDVFESYSFVHPFRDGTDTAVISLRDDVFVTRAECDIVPRNLLYNAGSLDILEGLDRSGWRVRGCDPSAVPGSGIVDRQCVSIDRLEATTDMPSGTLDISRLGRPIPYRVHFGDSLATTSASRLEQELLLGPGRFRVSWFARPTTVRGIAPMDAVQAWDAGSNSTRLRSIYSEAVEGSTTGWVRYWFFFDVPEEAPIRVVIPVGGLPITPRDVDVGGVMLEQVTSVVGDVARMVTIELGDGVTFNVELGQRSVPPPFFEPGEVGLTEVRSCPDFEGVHFRREAWEHDCVRVCTDGYDGNCPEEWSEARCFWQTSFDVSSDSLQNLLVAGDAGFAAGNFNYRIESVGVNLVGTGLRDCEAGGGTPGCYGSGNLSFSMLHQGPYLVRNALGRLYDAPLFPGRIESARALAAERFLTNPLSSADRGLIEPYVRTELQGRPMGGTLILRLWDDPRFRFDRLEDVQILLNYRYWQHTR